MKEEALEVIERALSQGRSSLVEYEAKRVLKAYGLPIPEEKLVENPDEAVEYANEIGYPVVLKLMSPQILHKSDAKVVALNVGTDEDLRKAWKEIHNNAKKYKDDAEIIGVLVAPMLKPGKEIIVGVTKDPQFGHALMFGLGGIYVDFLKDVSFGLAPLSKAEAAKMVERTKAYVLLRGVRGRPRADIEAVVEALVRVSKLVSDFPEVSYLDVNPLVAYESGRGCIALDVKMGIS